MKTIPFVYLALFIILFWEFPKFSKVELKDFVENIPVVFPLVVCLCKNEFFCLIWYTYTGNPDKVSHILILSILNVFEIFLIVILLKNFYNSKEPYGNPYEKTTVSSLKLELY